MRLVNSSSSKYGLFVSRKLVKLGLVCLQMSVGMLMGGISLRSLAQTIANPMSLTLQEEPLPFAPQTFYVSDLIDERTDRKAVAYLLPVTKSTESPAAVQPVDLAGGGLHAIRQFIWQGLARNTRLRPIEIRLKECRIMESAGVAGRVNGRVTVAMAFYLKNKDKSVHLTDYRGGARYDRSASQLLGVEPALRQSLIDALQFLNTWMNRQASQNEKLATGLAISFTYDTQPKRAEEDTVFYAANRPLTWDDFRAERTRPSIYAASVFPSFAYEGHSEVVNGIVQIRLLLKVFMLKNSSWVKESARDSYGLNHEQRHFDLVMLVAERFKQKLQPDSLAIEDYNSTIQYEYIESFREMNRLQEQYDEETHHGINQTAQERWNQRIDEELRSFAVKE